MKMLVPYWTTGTLASDLFDDVDRFFGGWDRVAPTCEVSESEEHYLMSVDLPGMKKEDIKIEMSNNILNISGERKREVAEKNQKVQRYERNYGFFKRSFDLPVSVQADRVEARYEDGVLSVYLPKTAAAKPRQIEIQSAKGGFFDKLLGSKKETQVPKEVTSSKVS